MERRGEDGSSFEISRCRYNSWVKRAESERDEGGRESLPTHAPTPTHISECDQLELPLREDGSEDRSCDDADVVDTHTTVSGVA